MVYARTPPDKAARLTADALVDRLIAIRDELAGGLDPVWVVAGIWKLIGEVEAAAEFELPPISGGSPEADDWEEIDPAFLDDPEGWPAYPDPEADGYRWEAGHEDATPLDVLAADAPAWGPSAEDWEAMYAAGRDGMTDADLAAAGLAIG